MRLLFFCVFLLLGKLCANAQHMYSKQFPFFNQLSSNEIIDMHQDKEGFLWIATTNGLARYDKYRLQNFRSDYRNENLLLNNAIINIDDSDQYVWITNWGGLNLYDKQTCRIMPFPDPKLQNKPVSYVAIDKQNDAWVSADRKIYRCDADATIKKEYDLITPNGKNLNNINTIYVDQSNRVWAITTDGLFGYDLQTDSFVHYPPFNLGNSAYVMFQDNKSNYWIGTWGTGLWQFFPDKAREECYKQFDVPNPRTNGIETIIFSIEQDDVFGYLWMLTYAGLHALKYTDEGTLENINIDELIDTQMMYTRFCKDREGNLWLGSFDMGYTIFFDNSNITNYLLPQLKRQIGWDANVLTLTQSNDSIIWFGQDRYGLCLYDPSKELFADTSIGAINIITKSQHQPGVWVNSSYTPHVMRLTQQNMKVQIEEDINLGGVIDLIEDKGGNLWIYTYAGIKVKSPDIEALIDQLDNIPWMTTLVSDTKGEIWSISHDRRIYRLNCIDGRIESEQKGSISVLSGKEEIKSICIDRDECLWLNTSLGRIFKSDKAKQIFTKVELGQAIDDCTVLGMLADKDNIWITANKRVLQYNLDTQTFRTYSTADEIIMVDVFRHKAINLDGHGGIFVGGHQGFIHISPDNVPAGKKTHTRPNLTDVKVDDKSIFFGESPGGNTINEITLRPNDRNIEIFFSPLIYSLSTGYRMAYQMEGIDKDWIHLDDNRSSAFYNNLPKGTYKLRVKLQQQQGEWSNDEILLTVIKTPALYETSLAYIIYTILIGLSLYVIFRFTTQRIKRKNEIKLQEELTRTKLVYFTNVSHELLTPLTVISCISDYMEQNVPVVKQQSVMLKANTDKLKRLIQQVLDFRKMDVGKLKLNVSEGDIHGFIQDICQISFLPLAQKKNIALETNINKESMHGFVDFDKLDKILHNLLSNAIKYTPENKTIYVYGEVVDEAGKRMLVIRINDEGIGIPPGEIQHIFTRFYSSRKNKGIESNGIGLSLTKDLVVLHHGTINVESIPGEGTCFTVRIPINKESYSADEGIDDELDLLTDRDHTNTEESTLPDATERPTILLIDDNTELLYVMKESFRERYTVITATDGQQALDKLSNNEVDMVICDVMLPDTNGWELCAQIKGDVRFNHTPVIILTAKNGIDDRVASYEAGADGYVAKPFEMKLLCARIDNLIKSYKLRQTAFRKEESLNLDKTSYKSAEKEFLQTLIDSILEHMSESEFDLEDLAASLHMSKSTMYRKIKSVTGLSPTDFIRNVKMKQACIMLMDKISSISDVAYSLGFNNPKYFSKCFKEEFGVTPSEYQQNHRS